MKKITKLAAAVIGVSSVAAPVITTSACSTVKWVDLTKTTAPTARMLQNSLPTNPARLSDINTAYFNAIRNNPRLWYDEILFINNPIKKMTGLTEGSIATARGAVWNLKVTNDNKISFNFRYEFAIVFEDETKDYVNIDVSFTKVPVKILNIVPMSIELGAAGGFAMSTDSELMATNDWKIKINNFESVFNLTAPKLETISAEVDLVKVKNKTINSENFRSLNPDEIYALNEIGHRTLLNPILYLQDIVMESGV